MNEMMYEIENAYRREQLLAIRRQVGPGRRRRGRQPAASLPERAPATGLRSSIGHWARRAVAR